MIEKNFLYRIISSFFLIPIIFFAIKYGSIFFNVLLIIALFISIYEWMKFNVKYAIKTIGFFFLIYSFYSIYLFRNLDNIYALSYFYLVVIICISADIGGYVFGKIFGGPKLTKISPNKTYTGVLGAYFFSILSSFFYLKINYFLFNTIFELILLILIISSISQVGDLIVSFFKRKSNLKDTGKIIPGHGGLLDRIDGMIFVFPISYLMLF